LSDNSHKPLATVIMAAGKGTRMKSDLPKVLHTIGEIPLVTHVVRLAQEIGSQKIIVIVGYKHELVEQALVSESVEFALQVEQLGTGHAVAQAQKALTGFKGNVLVLSGDVPLLTANTLNQLIKTHLDTRAVATILTADMDDPTGYGRVIRNERGDLQYIVEHKDANPNEQQIKEINSGIYVFESETLFKFLPKLQNKNVQGEYYLPDVLPMILSVKGKVSLEKTINNVEILGVNTAEQLEELNKNVSNKHHI